MSFIERKKKIYLYEMNKARNETKTLFEAVQSKIMNIATNVGVTVSNYVSGTEFTVTGETKKLEEFWDTCEKEGITARKLVENIEGEVPPTPSTFDDAGVASMLGSLITDEFQAIDQYNSAITTLRDLDPAVYEPVIRVLTDIAAEENLHVGQLQEVLKLVNQQAELIPEGAAEAAGQAEEPSVSPEEFVKESLTAGPIDYIKQDLDKANIPFGYDEDGTFAFENHDDARAAEEIICQVVGDKYSRANLAITVEAE